MPQKVLFISSFIGQNHSGGSMAGSRNLELCKQLFIGAEIVAYGFQFREKPLVEGIRYLPSHTSKFSTLINYSFGFAGALTFSNVKILIADFKSNNYYAVFLDGSLLGKLAKMFNQLNDRVIIITFFHNVEKFFFKSGMLAHPLRLPLYKAACQNERLAACYSRYLLCFNERDALGISKEYNKKIAAQFPVTVGIGLMKPGVYQVIIKMQENCFL